jgi:hypothetical protein
MGWLKGVKWITRSTSMREKDLEQKETPHLDLKGIERG